MAKKVPQLPEADSDEAATPTQADIERANALASTNDLLRQLWEAEEYDANPLGRESTKVSE